MSKHQNSRATRYLPQVAVATTSVAVLPVVVVWLLLAKGVVSSPWACVGLAVALSLLASLAGSAYWKHRSGHGDVLFSELLLWGWLHRFRSERRLANAVEMLGLKDAEQGMPESDESVERKAQILRQMAAALDAQDPYTDGHSRRVAVHAAMIARRMGLSREEVTKVRTAAAVHDIGKLRIPTEVLNKPGSLSEAEFEIVKRHAEEGAEIVSCMEDPEITAMVRHHHERFDGNGYPGGLLGVNTPVGARIIAVADTFDALTSARPYRSAISHKKALETILAGSGSQLDPVAVRAFLKCYSGKRALIFWTLLAVSPQRALEFLGGKALARANVGATATVAMPTALAAVVAAAFGSVGSVARAHSSAALAQQPSANGAVASSHPTTGSHRGASRLLLAATGPSAPRRDAVFAITVSRGSRRIGSHSPVGGSTTGGGLSGSVGGSGGRLGAGSGGRPGGGSRSGAGAVPLNPPVHAGPPNLPGGTKPPRNPGGPTIAPPPPPSHGPPGGRPPDGGPPLGGNHGDGDGDGDGDNQGDGPNGPPGWVGGGHGDGGHRMRGGHGHHGDLPAHDGLGHAWPLPQMRLG